MNIGSVATQIRTTDLEASIGFYTGILGLELAFRYEDFYAGIRVGEQMFHLKLVDERDPGIDFVTSGNHLHLYFTVADLDAAAAALRARGVAFLQEPANTAWGSREFALQDNEGHVLYFAEG